MREGGRKGVRGEREGGRERGRERGKERACTHANCGHVCVRLESIYGSEQFTADSCHARTRTQHRNEPSGVGLVGTLHRR